MIIGERIRNIREDKDILQQELADAVGINVSVLSRIEKGTRQLRDDELIKIADKLNVSVDYLLGRTDEPQGTGFQKGLLGNINDDSQMEVREPNQSTMNKAYTGYSPTAYHDPLLSEFIEQYPNLNDTAKAAINSILELAKAQQAKAGVTTAERIGNKILDASPEAQSAVNDIIKNDKK